MAEVPDRPELAIDLVAWQLVDDDRGPAIEGDAGGRRIRYLLDPDGWSCYWSGGDDRHRWGGKAYLDEMLCTVPQAYHAWLLETSRRHLSSMATTLGDDLLDVVRALDRGEWPGILRLGQVSRSIDSLSHMAQSVDRLGGCDDPTTA
jgi:hypothetical protein